MGSGVGGEGPGVVFGSLTDRSAFGFGVHRAVEVPDTEGLSELPVYVERPHDRALRAVVDRAGAGHSAMVTVVGGSSTGKTRACWEAVRRLPDGWRLWHPVDPTPPDAFLAAVGVLAPRTVVWLNEAQLYLLDRPDRGERVASALRTVLADARPVEEGGRGPVLVVATLWSEYWSRLTTRPDAEQTDVFAQQRALLTHAGVRVPAPSAFTADDQEALRCAAREDPRLALALEHAPGKVTQFLAGAPQLLNRYNDAHPAPRALIRAAMDARRLGLGPALPLGLLEDAAEGYLDDDEHDAIDDDWLEQALAYCVEPYRPPRHPDSAIGTRPQGGSDGIPGPLIRIRPRRGAPPQPVPAYRLADYLDQYGRAERRLVCPPAAFWEAAARHTPAADDLAALANAARTRGRFRHAGILYRRAADAGDAGALGQLALLRGDTVDRSGVEHLYRQAADAGHTFAFWHLALLREEAGDREGAERLYRQAAGAGHAGGLVHLALLREDAGDREGAERLARQAADAGALGGLALLRERGGDSDSAERLARQAADSGHSGGLGSLALLRERGGDREGAERLYRQAAEVGDSGGLVHLALSCEGAGDRKGAERLARQAADAGDSFALVRLALLREDAGDREAAERLTRQAADAGYAGALGGLALLRERGGDREGAERLYRQAADAGHYVGFWRLGLLLAAGGEVEESQILRYGLEPDGSPSQPW